MGGVVDDIVGIKGPLVSCPVQFVASGHMSIAWFSQVHTHAVIEAESLPNQIEACFQDCIFEILLSLITAVDIEVAELRGVLDLGEVVIVMDFYVVLTGSEVEGAVSAC